MKKSLGLTVTSLFAAAACANTSPKNETASKTSNASEAAQTASATTTPPTNDGEIMTIVSTANKAEVDAAKLAMQNAKSKDVKAFAKHMQQEHTMNDKQGMALAKKLNVKPEDAPHANTMKTDAQAKMEDLKSQKGADFDKAYINSQVEMHKQVLNDLQNTLIPAAKDPQLKTWLEKTSTHVKQHLEKAEKLQASLK